MKPAALVLAIGGSLVILIAVGLGDGTRRVLPSPSVFVPTVPPSTAAVAIPSGVPTTFRSVTSAGAIEWVRVATAAYVAPTHAIDGQIFGRNEDGATFVSSDAMTWSPTSLPAWGQSADYLQAAGQTLALVSPDSGGTTMGPSSSRQVLSRDWFDAPGDAAIYRWDGHGWSLVPLPTRQPPGVDGLITHSASFGRGAAVGDARWVAPIIHFIEAPWDDIYGTARSTRPDGTPTETGPWPIWDDVKQVLDVYDPTGGIPSPNGTPVSKGPYGLTVLASLTVELVPGDPPTIEFRDATTRELVHVVSATLPGWTPEALLTKVRSWGLEDVSLLVADGDDMTVVHAPWPMEEEWLGSVVSAGGRYYTATMPIGERYNATAVHLWASDDGLAWEPIALRDGSGINAAPFDWMELNGVGDRLFLEIHDRDGGTDELWTSVDGRGWTQAEVDDDRIGEPVATDFGWFMGGRPYSAVISVDGVRWDDVELPRLYGDPIARYLGGLLTYGPALSDGRYATWVGRFVDR